MNTEKESLCMWFNGAEWWIQTDSTVVKNKLKRLVGFREVVRAYNPVAWVYASSCSRIKAFNVFLNLTGNEPTFDGDVWRVEL